VEAFLSDAAQILDAAQAAAVARQDCDLAILVGPQGSIRVVEADGWATDSMRAHYGADRAYRVTRRSGKVRVEGRSFGLKCLLESEAGAASRPAHKFSTALIPVV
jgi:hypothetical protein